MNIYCTNFTVRATCHQCGAIHEENVIFGEPVPVSELELHAHENLDAAGWANSRCNKCHERTLETDT
jgi:NAD-dependent SIR2 family protein deacetylase